MGRPWKIVLALALVLPMGAFVAGSLVASAADDPAPRETIIIDEVGSTTSPSSPSPGPSTGPSPNPSPNPSSSPGSGPSDDSDADDDEADGLEEVGPEPEDMDDGGDDDNSGPGGGGGDDNSGPGGGDDDD